MSEDKEEKGIDHENPEEIIDDIISSYDEIQSHLIEGATLAGQEKERYQAIKPAWEELACTTTTDPDEVEVYASGISALASYRDELKEFQPKVPNLTNDFKKFIITSNSTASTTSGTISVLSHGAIKLPAEVTLPRLSKFESTKERLAQLDDTLPDTYSSIREILYGTQSDPERGALFLARQVFDHFFSLLAPDDLVRNSQHWTPHQNSDDPNMVTRFDRVIFAAHTHVEDSQKRSTLTQSARHLINVYRVMNKAHKRGALESERTRAALSELYTIIDSWIRSITIPLSFDDQST